MRKRKSIAKKITVFILYVIIAPIFLIISLLFLIYFLINSSYNKDEKAFVERIRSISVLNNPDGKMVMTKQVIGFEWEIICIINSDSHMYGYIYEKYGSVVKEHFDEYKHLIFEHQVGLLFITDREKSKVLTIYKSDIDIIVRGHDCANNENSWMYIENRYNIPYVKFYQ